MSAQTFGPRQSRRAAYSAHVALVRKFYRDPAFAAGRATAEELAGLPPYVQYFAPRVPTVQTFPLERPRPVRAFDIPDCWDAECPTPSQGSPAVPPSVSSVGAPPTPVTVVTVGSDTPLASLSIPTVASAERHGSAKPTPSARRRDRRQALKVAVCSMGVESSSVRVYTNTPEAQRPLVYNRGTAKLVPSLIVPPPPIAYSPFSRVALAMAAAPAPSVSSTSTATIPPPIPIKGSTHPKCARERWIAESFVRRLVGQGKMLYDVGGCVGGLDRAYRGAKRDPTACSSHVSMPILDADDVDRVSANRVGITSDGSGFITDCTKVSGCFHKLSDCYCPAVDHADAFLASHSYYYFRDADFARIGDRVMYVICHDFVGQHGVIADEFGWQLVEGEVIMVPHHGGHGYRNPPGVNNGYVLPDGRIINKERIDVPGLIFTSLYRVNLINVNVQTPVRTPMPLAAVVAVEDIVIPTVRFKWFRKLLAWLSGRTVDTLVVDESSPVYAAAIVKLRYYDSIRDDTPAGASQKLESLLQSIYGLHKEQSIPFETASNYIMAALRRTRKPLAAAASCHASIATANRAIKGSVRSAWFNAISWLWCVMCMLPTGGAVAHYMLTRGKDRDLSFGECYVYTMCILIGVVFTFRAFWTRGVNYKWQRFMATAQMDP